MRLAQIRTVESFARLTAAKRGRKFCRKMKTLAASTLFSIRIIPTSSSHHSGRRDDNHGFSPVAARGAAFIGQKITVLRGNVSRAMAFLAGSLAKLASPFLERIPTESIQSSRRRTVVSIAPTMLDSIGPG